MPKWKKDTYIPPPMSAEDNFRLSKFPTHRSCLWKSNSTSSFPRRWKDDRHYKKQYMMHKKLLEDAFCSSSSPFYLKFSPLRGISVHSKQDLLMTKKSDRARVKTLLSGRYSTFKLKNKVNWSIASLDVPKKNCGRPMSNLLEETEKEKQMSLYLVQLIS